MWGDKPSLPNKDALTSAPEEAVHHTDQEYNHPELDLTYMLSIISVYIYVTSAFFRITEASKLYYFYSDLKTFSKPPDFETFDAFSTKLSKIHCVYLQSIIMVMICSSNIFKTKNCEMENLEKNLTEVCGLFTYTWLPFDIGHFPSKQIYLVFQICGANYVYLLGGMMAWLTIEHACQIVFRMRHVKMNFIEAIEETNAPLRRLKFGMAVKYHAAVLGFFGLIPPKGQEFSPGIFFKIRFFTMMTFSSVPLLSSILHLIKTIKDQEYNHAELDLTYMLSFSSAYIYVTSAFLRATEASKLYYSYSDLKTFGKPPGFEKFDGFLTKLAKIHFTYLQSIIIFMFFVSNIFKVQTCERDNFEKNLTEVCGLFTYTWLPFDISHFPRKQIYLVFQIYGANYVYVLAGLMAWLTIEHACHIVFRLRHVKMRFIECMEEEDVVIRRLKFGNAVRYHSAVLGLADTLNELVGVFMLTHIVVTSAIMGCGVYAFSYGKSISTLLVCMGWYFGLLMDCFAGQILQDESLSLAEALYDSKWYECDDERFKRDLKFVIMRSKREMKLKAAIFGVMDMPMFLAGVKGAYSYITILGSSHGNH